MKTKRMEIPGHPGYFADRKGRIWTKKSGHWRLASSSINGTGYQYSRLGTSGQHLTQRLVCAAFKGDPTVVQPLCIRKAPRQQSRRVRKQRYLHWGDRSEIKRKSFTPLTSAEKFNILMLWASGNHTQVQIAKAYGVSQPAISCIISGKTKTY